jgi:hypothetical protein
LISQGCKIAANTLPLCAYWRLVNTSKEFLSIWNAFPTATTLARLCHFQPQTTWLLLPKVIAQQGAAVDIAPLTLALLPPFISH